MSVWQYQIKEISTPSLTSVRVGFMLKCDGTDYVKDVISCTAQELETLTNQQKLDLFKQMISDKAQPYILTYNVFQGLQQYVGATVTL